MINRSMPSEMFAWVDNNSDIHEQIAGTFGHADQLFRPKMIYRSDSSRSIFLLFSGKTESWVAVLHEDRILAKDGGSVGWGLEANWRLISTPEEMSIAFFTRFLETVQNYINTGKVPTALQSVSKDMQYAYARAHALQFHHYTDDFTVAQLSYETAVFFGKDLIKSCPTNKDAATLLNLSRARKANEKRNVELNKTSA